MLCSVRKDCGLGSPPSQFTTNAGETANSMLKSQTNYKRSEMFEFVEKLKQLIYEQDREIEQAIIGRGKYRLCPQYMSLHVPEVKWFVMSIPQREQHIRKFSPGELSEGTQDTLGIKMSWTGSFTCIYLICECTCCTDTIKLP